MALTGTMTHATITKISSVKWGKYICIPSLSADFTGQFIELRKPVTTNLTNLETCFSCIENY